MQKKYVCIHGHFYQPPRENPWLEEVELQSSAFPYHDWNERITRECYLANSQARILNNQGKITNLINNYSRISFNFGPTLLSWMRRCQPDAYEALIEADKLSQKNFSGHGSAIAQVYNHIIMPLANTKDKITSIYWGIKDFEFRFNRYPEGMWLAETAVDMETLEILADHNIHYTILAPHQAGAFRKLGKGGKEEKWEDVTGAKIDPTRPYKVCFPNGKSIAVFFYDGPISQAVAFERLLENGEKFVNRIMQGFNSSSADQLVHIATDGETYGHHHRHGEMALAYALQHFEDNNLAKITNYGEYLATHPPQYEVQIIEDTSWSCIHGIERWRSNCGCNSGMHPGWHQQWREPLRQAFDWLREQVDKAYEQEASHYFTDPWRTRNDFIEILVDRSRTGMQNFLTKHALNLEDTADSIKIFKLLEIQRNRLLMYTSCGWFFDEISGIGTVQCLQYAVRVIQLYKEVFNQDVEGEFLSILQKAPSNLSQMQNGKNIFLNYAKKCKVDLNKVAAHYIQSSVFSPYDKKTQIFSYDVDINEFNVAKAGKASLLTGDGTIYSQVTWERERLFFCAFHFGDHNITAGIKQYASDDGIQKISQDANDAFEKGDFMEIIQMIDRVFSPQTYSLSDLFRDQQYEFVSNILSGTMDDVEAIFLQLFNNNIQILNFLNEIDVKVPTVLNQIAEHVKEQRLLNLLQDSPVNLKQLEHVTKQISKWQVKIDADLLSSKIEEAFTKWLEEYQVNIYDISKLAFLNKFIVIIQQLPISIDFDEAQVLFIQLERRLKNSEEKDELLGNEEWRTEFKRLAVHLDVELNMFDI